MSAIAIRADSVSKLYTIGGRQDKHQTLGDTIAGFFSSPLKWARGSGEDERSFWALNDVSFDIESGDVVGVIGRNGAGKSTLLKVLSRITGPTKGRIDIYGRIGSLLEVGTGFHAELSGRENIYLNGAILGMKRKEIDAKFDEIVAFSEIDKFIDTPVKHYSSGMYMRLAFAVAAHLEPEILLVDEVLAVGDAAFQRKCLGKMGDVAKQGRTVLFVSHNMPTVQSLCKKALLLEGGKIRHYGDIKEGVRLYHQSFQDSPMQLSEHAEIGISTPRVNGQEAPQISADEPLTFDFDVVIRKPIHGFRMFLLLEGASGTIVLHAASDEQLLPDLKQPGHHKVTMRCPALHVTPGVYSVHAKIICQGIGIQGRYLSDRALVVVDGIFDPGMIAGMLTPPLEWKSATV